jgi:hypothetical protein
MNTKIITVLLSLVAGIFVQAENYEIQVCKVDLGRAISVELPPFLNLFHVFVKGREYGQIETLNFDPVISSNIDGIPIAAGKSFPSYVSKTNFEGAECQTIWEGHEGYSYHEKWKIISDFYTRQAQVYDYQLYNVQGKNCGKVAEEAVHAASLKFPFPGINAQDHADKFLYDVGSLGNIETAGEAVENVVRVIEGAGNIINNVTNKKDCNIQ